MLKRRHQTAEVTSEAIYSECEAYRYKLSRRWGSGGIVNFVMLNPSVANELRNDPTVERCERRARQLGFGAFSVTNIFAWRDTDPFAMRRAAEPVGPKNDTILLTAAQEADQVIAAWGTHGAHRGRGPEVASWFQAHQIPLFHLGLSKERHPRHPLYIPYTRQPEVWKDF